VSHLARAAVVTSRRPLHLNSGRCRVVGTTLGSRDARIIWVRGTAAIRSHSVE
jgi:hypothetical protein